MISTILPLRVSRRASARLFCFPYLGGNVQSIYADWSQRLDASLDLYGVEYPGHGKCTSLCVTDFESLTRILSDAIIPFALEEMPLVFYGHSLGALIAFEVARELQRRQMATPVVLFAAACSAPQALGTPPQKIKTMDDLIAYLQSLGAQPVRSMLKAYWHLFQADMAIGSSYRYQDREPLSSHIVALVASHDPSVHSMREWQSQTSQMFYEHQIEGSHLFLHEKPKELLDIVQDSLHRLMAINSLRKYVNYDRTSLSQR